MSDVEWALRVSSQNALSKEKSLKKTDAFCPPASVNLSILPVVP